MPMLCTLQATTNLLHPTHLHSLEQLQSSTPEGGCGVPSFEQGVHARYQLEVEGAEWGRGAGVSVEEGQCVYMYK